MIISTNSSGLGNRIKSWVSAMRLDADAYVYWPLNKNMPADFTQLFSNDCAVDSILPEAGIYNSWRLIVLPEDKIHLPIGFSTAGAGAHPIIRGIGKVWWNLRGRPTDRYRYMVFPKTYKRSGTLADARYIDYEYERIPEYFRKLFVPLFQKILVRPEIMRAVNGWADANIDETVVGVQVRTWRDSHHRFIKYHNASKKRLFRLITDSEPSDRFLILSDSDDIIPALKQKYGERRILHFPRQIDRCVSWQTPDGIIEDFMDMMLLSRTSRMILSYLSTFGEAAWWLGGAVARVRVF